MIKLIIISISLLFVHLGFSQESLLLGEVRLDEVQTDKIQGNVERVMIYGKKYKKNGHYKDSIVKGTINYSAKGEEMKRVMYGGKKNRNQYIKKYKYDLRGNVISYDNQIVSNGAVIGKSADFFYDGKDRVIQQVISLATIEYTYDSDGRLLYKQYIYNNGMESKGEPWTMYYEYDQNGNLIHVDNDTTGNEQTSFYDDKNQLIRHDYYPGVAYSTYTYDERGNCTQQIDYELGKKGWDSLIYVFVYDEEDRLIQSSSSKKRGKITLDQEWVFYSNGKLKAEYFYRKNKRKWVNRYYYEKYPFKG